MFGEIPVGDTLCSHLGLNSNSFDRAENVSELVDSSSCTDVKLVPEHEKQGFEEAISHLQGEIAELTSKLRSLDQKRREALNKLLDIKGSIRVFCRVRPLLFTDRRRTHLAISISSEKIFVRSIGCKKEFTVDKVFPQETTQEDVFLEVQPILRSALDGHNVCIFAYGQTGTGKTFTMEGAGDHLGIVPRALEELFHQAAKAKSVPLTFSISMLEVYMGNLRDLLASRPPGRTIGPISKSALNVQTSSNGSVEIERLTDVVVSDFAQANRWYCKGRRARATSWTNVNEASSRSHCLTRITISGEGRVEPSKLWMVDLGGSERLLKTGATGQTMEEGKAINLSLSALADVIAALKRKRNHVPYRNSKLTQILRDSLGDGSKALMLVHISSTEEDVGETICSLNFAERSRAIESNKELSEDMKRLREKRIADLDQQMMDAEEEYRKVREQLKLSECLLQKKMKLFSMAYQLPESPNSPQILHQEVFESPRVPENVVQATRSRSVPRFMSSTTSSRSRQNPEGEISGMRLLRPGPRRSHERFVSQSMSLSGNYSKASLRSSKAKPALFEPKKSRHGEANSLQNENPICNSLDNNSNLSSIPRNKRVTTSHPDMRVMLGRHRRRMSDLT
ncbi:kinesin-like protein KIN-14O [Aristolochia californica]|uniref:kinesin-like protein KIN-14O n=1 Tax=Aristolochia californica TaxID=171875 RepID=UPI0035DBBDED